MMNNKEFKPKDTIIAFDIHYVLFKPHFLRILTTALRQLPLWLIITTILSPVFWYRVHKIRKKTNVSDKVLQDLTELYPSLAKHVPVFEELINAQYPIKKTIDIAFQLKQLGYPLYILSNIGYTTFAGLCSEHTKLRSLFDGIFTPSSDNAWLHKPAPLFYEQFKELMLTVYQHDKKILFIDDILANVQGAQSVGINALHFTSPEELERQLKELTILPE